ncbi:hypothetical protein U1701_14005 [Sphingomonas sp. PB2P19]|uniref:hypothetical protein n=1 Tax=Sphingomonas rhamnosi TaxID=3096156 RepID=UPI002FC6165C
MMPQDRGPDAGTLLIRALRTMGAEFAVRIDSIAGRPWASATFAGTRHVVRLSAPDVPDVRSWLTSLPEAEFALRGHIIADLALDSIETLDGDLCATLTVLSLEES